MDSEKKDYKALSYKRPCTNKEDRKDSENIIESQGNLEDVGPAKLQGLIKNLSRKQTTSDLNDRYNNASKFEEELKKNDYFLQVPM